MNVFYDNLCRKILFRINGRIFINHPANYLLLDIVEEFKLILISTLKRDELSFKSKLNNLT